ncbi:hypothetical protein G6F65_022130 [Rhizopus arrhizus]|nr:hypothetical protein G6F65_022130 [Rhizopus arrhizus]
MAGLAAAASLTHLGIAAPIFDQAPEGYEGPWATTARMETLRSPKQLTGPALGLPALTAGQDSPPAMDGLPALVSPRAEPGRAQRTPRVVRAAARRPPGAAGH